MKATGEHTQEGEGSFHVLEEGCLASKLCLAVSHCTMSPLISKAERQKPGKINKMSSNKDRLGPVTCVNHLLSLESSCIFSQTCS